MTERSKIEETFCIQVGEIWCAVLGNHYPNLPHHLAEELSKLPLQEAVPLAHAASDGKDWCIQRLCDQNNVQYKYVVVQAPTCPECLRIKQLMVEFARPADQEEDDDGEDDSEGRRDTTGSNVVQGEQLETEVH